MNTITLDSGLQFIVDIETPIETPAIDTIKNINNFSYIVVINRGN